MINLLDSLEAPYLSNQSMLEARISLIPPLSNIWMNVEASTLGNEKIAIFFEFLDAEEQILTPSEAMGGRESKLGPRYLYITKDNHLHMLSAPKEANVLRLLAVPWPMNRNLRIRLDGFRITTDPNLTVGSNAMVPPIENDDLVFPTMPGRVYSLTIDVQADGISETLDKHVLLMPRLRRSDGTERALPTMMSVSNKYGAYKYGAIGTTSFAFEANDGDESIVLRTLPWKATNSYKVKGHIEPIGMSVENQASKIDTEFERFEARAYKRIILIYTGTTEIGKDRRANRSMMLARAFSKMGWGVIYVYFRGTPMESIMVEQMDGKELDGILQLPHDMFWTYATRITKLHTQDRLALQSFPDAKSAPLADMLRRAGWTQILEARDDWEEFRDVGSANWYRPEFERYLAERCNASISVSPPLRSKMIAFGADPDTSFIVPNAGGRAFIDYWRGTRGADTTPSLRRSAPGSYINDIFDQSSKGNIPALTVVPRKNLKIGYFGHLTEKWFDWTLIIQTARRSPHMSFDLIGHGHQPKGLPENVRLLGPMSHAEIIAQANDWDVGIIPFIPGRLANAVDPIKIYEYLCLGLPVVSVYMDQIVDYPNTYLYRTGDTFLSALQDALSTPFDSVAGNKLLSKSGWRDRAQTIVDIYRGEHT